MSIVIIDGRKSLSYVKNSSGRVIGIRKMYKDNYSLFYFQGEKIANNLSKCKSENVINRMNLKYFSNI